MKLASYFDYYDWGLDKQLSLYTLNDLDYFILRKVANKSFLDYQNQDEIINHLKKVSVGLFDPLLNPIDFDNEKSVNELLKVVEFSKKLKVKTIVIKIKHFDKETSTVKEIKDYLNNIIKITKGLNLIIEVDNYNDIYIYNIIANEVKLRKVKLAYNPAAIYLKDYSPITAYRLFKPNMGLVEVADISKDKEAILLGHGVVDIVDLFKKMYRDKYRGLIALNSNLDEVFKNFGTSHDHVDKKQKKTNTKKYLETITKLGYVSHETKEEIPFEEVINHQIKLLKIVFK